MMKSIYLVCFGFSESDGNHSTEDESSKGQEDMSPRPLSSSSTGSAALGNGPPIIFSDVGTTVIHQIGDVKMAANAAGAMGFSNDLSGANSHFLNGGNGAGGYVHPHANNMLLNGLGTGGHFLTFDPQRTSLAHERLQGGGGSYAPFTLGLSETTGAAGKLDSMQTLVTHSEDGGASSVVTFTPSSSSSSSSSSSTSGLAQLSSYSVVHVPGTEATMSLPPLLLPPSSTATSHGR